MSWQMWAAISAVAAGVTSVFAKAGLEDVPANLGNAVRTAIILAISLGVLLVSKESTAVTTLSGRTWALLAMSGLATAVSWVAFFHALAAGPATPVTAIDRASLVVTMLLAFAFLGEPIGVRRAMGALLVVAGAVLASTGRD
jgi:transporter family protein